MMKITTEIMEYGYAFLYERYRLPLYVTECGLSCTDHIFLDGQVHDADRIDFLHRYFLALYRGCERADIRGFFHWSLTDNFEWHSGYAERFWPDLCRLSDAKTDFEGQRALVCADRPGKR